MRSGNVGKSLALVVLSCKVYSVNLHRWPEISLPQDFVSQRFPPSMIATDPFVDLLKYEVPFLEVDTFQKRG